MKKKILILMSMFTLLLFSMNYVNSQTSCNKELFKTIQKIATPKNVNKLLKHFYESVNFLSPPEVFFEKELKPEQEPSSSAKLSKKQIIKFLKAKKNNSVRLFFFKDLTAEKGDVLVNADIQDPTMCFINSKTTRLTVKFVENNWYFVSFGYVSAG